MRSRLLTLFCLSFLATGCDKLSTLSRGSSDKSAEKSDDDEDDKPAKKSKKKKHEDDATEPSATGKASSAPTAAPTSAPTSAPTAAAGGLASLFTGDPDPAIKFQRQKQIPNKPVWIQVVPYWKANTDEPSNEEPWSDLTLSGKEDHATIHLWIQKRDAKGIADVDVRNNLAWAHVTDAHFDAPVAGTLGQGISAQIAKGSGQMSKRPVDVWWMVSPMKGNDDLAVFVAVRSDVYPKLMGETVAMLRTLKIAGP